MAQVHHTGPVFVLVAVLVGVGIGLHAVLGCS